MKLAISPHSFRACLLLLGAALLTSNIAPATAQPVRPAALRAQVAELEREAAELREAGRPDEALELMQRAEELRTELNRGRAEADGNQRPPREPREVRQPRTPREPRFERPDPAEIERRAHHLEVAIDNLHAAGLHEPAERLTQPLEQMRRQLAEMRPRRPDAPELPGEAIAELRAQIGELHRMVRQLRAELEELRREHAAH